MTSLPPELLLRIFDNASVQTLISLSLSSHQIRILVFPLFHRHVVFKKNEELFQFTSRVLSETNGDNLIDQLRFADHVHHLEFGGGKNAEYERDELELLTQALQHLKALRGLTWSALLPEDPTIFSAVQTTCQGIQDIRLHLQADFDGEDDDYMETLFGFRGLKHLEISTHAMYDDDGKLPSSMVDMIRASPNLLTLDLSFDIYGNPHHNYRGPLPMWDIDTLFQSVDIVPNTLRLRIAFDLDIHAFSDSTQPTPFRSFLLSHHERITSLALPANEEDFPPSLNLPSDTLSVLREFEGSVYWCSQLSKLQVAAKLESLTMLLGRLHHMPIKPEEVLQGFSSLKALNMFDGKVLISVGFLKLIVDNAPHLESLSFGLYRNETADTIGPELSRLNLRALATNMAWFSAVPKKFVQTLATYCASLVTVEDLYHRDHGTCWVATILRKEGDIDLEVSQTQIWTVFAHDYYY